LHRQNREVFDKPQEDLHYVISSVHKRHGNP
jgi:hypothetical protein